MNSFHQLYQMQMHQIHLPIHPRILEGNPLTQRVEPETAKKTKTKATKTTKGASCGGSILDYVLGPHPIRGRIEKVQQSAELKNVERPFLFKRHPPKKKVRTQKGNPQAKPQKLMQASMSHVPHFWLNMIGMKWFSAMATSPTDETELKQALNDQTVSWRGWQMFRDLDSFDDFCLFDNGWS